MKSKPMTKNGVPVLLKLNFISAVKKVFLTALTLFLFFSCKSAPQVEPVDPLNLIDARAPVIIYIPVTANRSFVEYAMITMAGMTEKDASTIAGRTKNVAISSDSDGAFQIALEGSYPKIGINMALTEKKGWKSAYTTDTTLPVVFYSSESYGLQVGNPDSLTLLAGQSVSPLLKRYENEQHRLILASQGVEDSIEENPLNAAIYDFLKDNNNTEIRFYSQNPAAFLNKFLGKALSLGLNNISGSLVESKADKTFALKLELELTGSTVSKAVVKMLKIALFPIPAKIVQTGENHVQITDISFTYNQLIKLIKR